MKNILEHFENIVKKYPDKVAFSDIENEISYASLYEKSRQLASGITKYNFTNKPIVLFFDKNIREVQAMLSVIYSGNFYVVLDPKMPLDRIESIFETLNPELLIYDDCFKDEVNDLCIKKESYSQIITNINSSKLDSIRDVMIDTDICYAIFTSGSTGKPKGTIVNHITLLRYMRWYVSEFDITSETIFGGQTPFYFSASVSDFFATIMTGATYHIIPKSYFMFPMKIVELLNLKKVNTIYWVPSALGIMSNLDVFKYAKPLYLKKIMFIGEVMPVKHLNYYLKYLPDCEYTNLFGPTETVDVCTFYKVNRHFEDDEPLPIGRHCDNCDVFILKDDNTLASVGEEGELCVRGSFLAQGYYNMPQKTSEAFCLNPLNTNYFERIYRTGDICKYNEFGELMYVTRKDFQIKHMGYRIELGEIETAITSMEKIKSSVCIYDDKEDNIILIYEGRAKEDDIYQRCEAKLPKYMHPNKIIKVSQMVLNGNGKIDRTYYKKNYKELIK